MVVRFSSDSPVRVRFAPSPTGALHLGSAFVALANAAWARGSEGALVLRIDDTDQQRSHDRDVADLLRLVRWLGIEWDEGPIYQSRRADIYRSALDRLLQLDGAGAYPCFCGVARIDELRAAQVAAGEPPRYDGRCRRLPKDEVDAALASGAPHVLRFAVPEGRDVTFEDLVHGEVTFPAGSFGDPVLCRADGSAGYLLASVVDDIDLGITHVIRGEDHLANSARQLLLFEALKAPALPAFAHLPLLRDTDGRKLSKREPLGTLDELVDEGFLPVTVRRYLAELLGQDAIDLLSGSDDQGERFALSRISTGAPRVDRTRLESLGREDIAALSLEQLLEGTELVASDQIAPIVMEIAAASPSRVALRGELRLVFDGPGAGDLPHVIDIAMPAPETRVTANAALDLAVVALREAIAKDVADAKDSKGVAVADDGWAAVMLASYRAAGKEKGMGTRDVLRPLRIALTGSIGGPGLGLVLRAIGAREALRRVHVAQMVLDEVQEGGNHAVGG
ncbi:MAG: glutamate--tRNA ligase [Gaiellales bacterium]